MESAFLQATQEVKSLKVKPSQQQLLQLYGLYKQASLGDVNIPKPGFFDMQGSAKWNAWSELKGTSKEEAMEKYIELVKHLSDL